HAILKLKRNEPLSDAQLAALNNADDLNGAEKILREQDIDFLMGIRGLASDEALNNSLIRGATFGQIALVTVLSGSTRPSTALVLAMLMGRSEELGSSQVGLIQERLLYQKMPEDEIMRLTGKNKAEALAFVEEEAAKRRELD